MEKIFNQKSFNYFVLTIFSHVSLTPCVVDIGGNLLPMLLKPAVPVTKFAAGLVDTRGKFATGVIGTGGRTLTCEYLRKFLKNSKRL
jgi:hypothetical protein